MLRIVSEKGRFRWRENAISVFCKSARRWIRVERTFVKYVFSFHNDWNSKLSGVFVGFPENVGWEHSLIGWNASDFARINVLDLRVDSHMYCSSSIIRIRGRTVIWTIFILLFTHERMSVFIFQKISIFDWSFWILHG